MNPTQTIDVMLIRNQLVNELAAISVDADACVSLRRQFVEQILNALRHPYRRPDQWDVEILRPIVLDEMRRLSPTGEAVSKARWDIQRAGNLPSAQRTCRLLGEQWSTLAAAAGLTPNHYTREHAEEYNQTLDEPSDVGIELDPPAIEGLAVASKRVETHEYGQIRTVTEIYMLR